VNKNTNICCHGNCPGLKHVYTDHYTKLTHAKENEEDFELPISSRLTIASDFWYGTNVLQGKDFVIEIQDCTLSLYGQDSLKYMEAKWITDSAQTVTKAKFQFIQHDDLVTLYPRFKERFPNLVDFHFRETCLDRLGQLNGLAIFPKMTSLYISSNGNSVVHHPQWKLYAIYRLGNRGLKMINGTPVNP
jgi:hypothetical protein